MDCSPTCLRMVGKFYGRNLNNQKLRDLCQINKEGVNLLGISEAAEKLGFRSSGVKVSPEQLKETELPYIALAAKSLCGPLQSQKREVLYRRSCKRPDCLYREGI